MWKFFLDEILCPLNSGVLWIELSQRRGSTILWRCFNQSQLLSKCSRPAPPNCLLLLVFLQISTTEKKNYPCDNSRLVPVEAPSHARLRQLVTWPVKDGDSLSLSDLFKNKFEGWLVIHESPGGGRTADSGSGEDWFEPWALCCHFIFLDRKLFFVLPFPS